MYVTFRNSEIGSDDDAIWDRSTVIEFPYTFVNRPLPGHHREVDKSRVTTCPKMGHSLVKALPSSNVPNSEAAMSA